MFLFGYEYRITLGRDNAAENGICALSNVYQSFFFVMPNQLKPMLTISKQSFWRETIHLFRMFHLHLWTMESLQTDNKFSELHFQTQIRENILLCFCDTEGYILKNWAHELNTIDAWNVNFENQRNNVWWVYQSFAHIYINCNMKNIPLELLNLSYVRSSDLGCRIEKEQILWKISQMMFTIDLYNEFRLCFFNKW